MRTFPLLALLAGCPKGVTPAQTAPELFLQPVPAMAARIELHTSARDYAGPARLEVHHAALPIELSVEDLEQAEVVQARVISTQPVAYGAVAGNAFRDVGTFVQDRDRLILNFTRRWPDGEQADYMVLADMAPAPHAPPRDWMAPGTTLYYGITYDDKPITRLVPMALTVRIGAAQGGERLLDWAGDIDPDTRDEFTTERTLRGRRVIPAAVVEDGVIHDDRLGAGVDDAATSVFISHRVRRILTNLGGAPWQDGADAGVLTRQSELDVVIQADDALWSLPSTVATLGAGTYVIAQDPQDPLLISAVREGWRMKLMAIGRPASGL